MPAPVYVPVTPREHSSECRRGKVSPTGSHEYALDRDRCERCRNLWARLIEVGARRREGGQ